MGLYKNEGRTRLAHRFSLQPVGRKACWGYKNEVLNTMSKLKQTINFLKRKGYDLTGKTPRDIFLLAGMYRDRPGYNPNPQPKEWKSWSGTNRPHHKG